MKVSTVHDDKSVLRRKFKELRRSFQAAEGRPVADQLSKNLERFLGDYPNVQICLYRARREEAPCALAPVERFFYPVIQGETLEFRRPHDDKSFQTNALSIEEPIPERSTPLTTAQPVLVLCPAVGVDVHGTRLGLGKGYYDRFFSEHAEALRVGVIYQVQVSAAPLPADSWDQALDWIVSEKMILRTTSTRSSLKWT